MKREKNYQLEYFSRRAFIIVMAKAVLFFLLLCRIFYLQVIKAKDYKTLSDKNSISIVLLEPERGKILDCSGKELAINRVCYRLMLYKQRHSDLKNISNSLATLLKWNQEEQEQYYKILKSAPYLRPIILIDNISWDQVCLLEEQSHQIEDIYIDTGSNRVYLHPALYAHVIGYIGIPSKEDLKKLSGKMHQQFKVGKTGIEKNLDQELIGNFGIKKVEVNAYRTIVREISKEDSQAGKDVKLSIDHRLQEYAYNLISDKAASILLLDTQNGNVLTLVSTPSFDPNQFTQGISSPQWQEILRNKDLPLHNKTISKLYPPGSTFKIVTSLAILESGIDPQHSIFCNGAIDIRGRHFKCWKHGGHGKVNFLSAVAGSCNCYFYQFGLNAGIDRIYAIARKLGLGQKTNILLPGEVAGNVPNQSWKRQIHKESWFVGDTVNTSIGQGFLLSTPLQINLMTARVASGKMLFPQLINNDGADDDLDLNPEHLNLLRQGLSAVFNEPFGTGYASRITEERFSIAGKTGTAQVISQDTAGPGNKFAKQYRSHSIFTGYAPTNSPRFACTAIVDNGGWGSHAATPIAREMLLYAQKLYLN